MQKKTLCQKGVQYGNCHRKLEQNRQSPQYSLQHHRH